MFLTMALLIVVVSVKTHDMVTVLSPTIYRFENSKTFEEVFKFLKFEHANLSCVDYENVKIKQNTGDSGIIISDPKKYNLTICDEVSSKYIEFILSSNTDKNNNDLPPPVAGKNAFTTLLDSMRERKQPSKIVKPSNGPAKLRNDVIDWISEFDEGWTLSTMQSGEDVVKSLSSALWYIDTCHQKFSDNGCPVPKLFRQFSGYNDYKKIHHRVPEVTCEKLNEHCLNLNKVLEFPSMASEKHKQLAGYIQSLFFCLTKYKARLEKDNERHKNKYQAVTDSSNKDVIESDSQCYFIKPTQGKVENIYTSLNKELGKLDNFVFIDLDRFSPADRIERRKYIKEIKLSHAIMIYRINYGGNIGTLNFVWKVPTELDNSTKNGQVIRKISSSLPKYSTRAMRRDFINKYSKHVKTPKVLLRHMYHDLTKTVSSNENDDQRLVNERLTENLLMADDAELLLDYRKMNGKDIDEKFDKFFNEMGKYFEEQVMSVQERRHGEELYLPLAISIEDLKSQVIKRCPPDTPVPNSETIRLQFTPANPFKKTAMKYSGHFDVKFRVQTRQARAHHIDGRYVATTFKYLKQFCVKFRRQSLFVCVDDKSIVPIGEPGCPISSGVRGHNKVMAPASGPVLVAADHDFHIAGLVPSVALVTETPNSSNDSFFSGQVFVTTKDKVFQPSSPIRHATELTRILRDHYCDDNVNLNVPVLCILSDGGPDHRITYESVKVSLIQLFMQLDLDLLIAIRTAPNNSWLNPAERCMAILNLGLQHVALSRNPMPENFEKMIKNKSSLNAVRNATTRQKQLKEAFGESVQGVIAKVNERFSRLKLKGETFKTYIGVTEEDMEDAFKIINDTTNANVDCTVSSKEFKQSKEIQEFIKRHGLSTHYSFQLRKCRGDDVCPYCQLNPPRSETHFSFLPCPVPDESGLQYQSFDELYGKDVDDSHRPSSKNTSSFDDEAFEYDKRNRDVFKAVKARDAIECAECEKPRMVYSASKTTREQDAVLRRTREEKWYTCGDSLPEEIGLFTKRCLSCVSEIEITYYSAAVRSYLPPCCIYCGTKDNLLDETNEYISNLLNDYSCVRPLCEGCRAKNLEAKTWGKKFFKKTKR